MNKKDEHILYIQKIFHNVQSITLPVISGVMHPIYIVDTKEKKYICRFSDKRTALYNVKISKLLQSHGIKAPEISVANEQNTFCEIYPFIHGKTFRERIIEGMSKEQQNAVFKQLYDMSYKINQIKTNITFTSYLPWYSYLITKLFDILNLNEQNMLTHTDLHPGNVILDKQDNVCALLDLESVYLCKPALSFIKLINFISNLPETLRQELIDSYNKQYPSKRLLPIETQIKLYHKIYWLRTTALVKHILNLKTK